MIGFAEQVGGIELKVGRLGATFCKCLNALSARFQMFQMQLLISRFSDQEQGIELYELLQWQLRVEHYRKTVLEQLQGAFEIASLMTQNRSGLIIGIVGAILALLQVILALR